MKRKNRVGHPLKGIARFLSVAVLGIVLVTCFYIDKKDERERAENIASIRAELKAIEKEEKEEKEQLAHEDSFYQKLKDGLDVSILVIGDSIGAGSGATSEENCWYYLLKQNLQKEYDIKVTVTNVSMGGNTSYAGYVRTMILDDDIDYDLAILCYGQNDATENFSFYYESIIRTVKNKYDGCALISILESSQREYTKKMLDIQHLAKHYNIPVADTIVPFTDKYDNLVKDNVHPNDEGQKIYFERVKTIIDNNVELYLAKDKGIYKSINDGVEKLDTCRYIGKNEFEVVDDKTLEIDINISGMMGIDYTYESGDNKCTIYIDDEEYAAPVVTFDYDFSQRHILVVNDECIVKDTIRIEFMTAEQCEGFEGIIFSGIS